MLLPKKETSHVAGISEVKLKHLLQLKGDTINEPFCELIDF